MRITRTDDPAKVAKHSKPVAKAEAETPTSTAQLAALTGMNLAQLREEYQRVFGKPSLSRNRKALLKRIAEKVQADGATSEASPGPALKPTLTVKFERKRGKKSGGKAAGRSKAKAAAQGKEPAAAGRTTRISGQRDPRLPRAGTDLVREWHGKKYVVRVLESGFEYNSKPFRSLSAVAKAICGQIVNGPVWFGLGLPSKEKKSS